MKYLLTKEDIEDIQRKAAAWGIRTLCEGLQPETGEDRETLDSMRWFASGLENPKSEVAPFPEGLEVAE